MTAKILAVLLLLAALAVSAAMPAARADSFTLSQCISYALDHNKALTAKKEDVPQADGRLKDAWSPALPHLDATAGYTWLSDVPTIKTPGSPDITTGPAGPQVNMTFQEVKMGSADNYRLDLKLTQNLFTSGMIANGIRSAKAAGAAAREGVLAQQETLEEQVAEAFYGVLFAQDLYRAKKESLDVSRAHLEDVRKSFQFGASSRYELLRSELDVANLEPQVLQAENNVRIAKTGLKSAMGYDLGQPIDVSGTLEGTDLSLDYDAAISSAVKNRHELAVLDRSFDAQHAGTWVATAGMLPKLTAFGENTLQKPWYFSQDWKDIWSVGLGLSVPLFDGLSAWGKRGESLAKERQIKKQKAVTLEGIDLTIRRALLDLTEIRDRIVKTRDNVGRSDELVRIVDISYRNGVATNIDVLDAQLAMTNAKTAYIQALYDFQIARTKLLAAAGRLNAQGVEK